MRGVGGVDLGAKPGLFEMPARCTCLSVYMRPEDLG